MFTTGPLYLANLNSPAQVVVNQGGTSSGKTYAILQVLFSIAVREKATITVVGQDIPNLKVGALRDALEIYDNSEQLKNLISSYNKTDRIFQFTSGSTMEFKSYQNSQDAKSGKRQYLFINEANGIHFPIYMELALRTTKKIFIDYNPNEEFWVHTNVIPVKGVELLISDHRHNPFVSDQMREKIEELKNFDLELWKVYARGMTGKIEGLIFRNWDKIQQVPDYAQFLGYGLDFGFTNDPTALIAVYRADGELILDEVIYRRGLTNPELASMIHENYNGEDIIADSAEPKSIRELSNLGLNIYPAEKGPDSIRAGIDAMKRFSIKITTRSINLIKEFNSYKWKQKQDGTTDTVPIDFMNHGIDAARYFCMMRLMENNADSWTDFA